MNRCPITYELCDQRYSIKGLKKLSRNLKELHDFPFTPQEQVERALQLAAKLSIQGVQPKLSVVLNVAKHVFEIVEKGGRFILKPPHQIYMEIPENEDITMRLANSVGIEVPFHGMVYNVDGSRSYFIQRFDRLAKGQKMAVEDFSQLLGCTRDTKYESSMEKVASVIETYCTFPLVEKIKLFRRTIFSFLVGNEDMHLKNFTLIRIGSKVELSPAYDLLNTTIIFQPSEELALPIRGKKSRLTYDDFVNYFGRERLKISEEMVRKELNLFEGAQDSWRKILSNSFLSEPLQKAYEELVKSRWQRIRE